MIGVPFADSHCHLDDVKFDGDRDGAIERAREAGVAAMVNIGCDLETSLASVELSRRNPDVYATVGLHPHDARLATPEFFDRLSVLATETKVVAIGEIGLDYHYDNSPRETQRRVFAEQIQLARTVGLPIVIHTRSAFADTFDILRAERPPVRGRFAGVFHCFSGGVDEAREALGLGFALSFAGPVSYPAASALRQAAAYVPQDALLVETDAPYLAPQPRRGRRNEPAFIEHTIRCIAEARESDPVTVATTSLRNTIDLFGLPPETGHLN